MKPGSWVALGLALAVAGSAAAQDAPDAEATLEHSAIDRATVRVLALRGVGVARVAASGGGERLLAVPDATQGSGLLLEGGLVLTARHVVEGAGVVAVWIPGQSRARAAQVVVAGEDDYAFLALGEDASDGVALPDDRPLRIRQTVDAVGYPLDARRGQPQSRRGIVAGVLPSGHLQLDLALDPGNSGGPLIDEDERVVGIVVARGDPTGGVQGVPLAPLRSALANQVLGGVRLQLARAALTGDEHGVDTAELAELLAGVGASEGIREVAAVVDLQGSGDFLPRLRTLALSTQSPLVLAMVAAYVWDVAAVALERAGGVLLASQVPDPNERSVVRGLLDTAVALCRRAASLDPSLAARSTFVGHVARRLAHTRPAARRPAPARTEAVAAATDTLPPPDHPVYERPPSRAPPMAPQARAPRWLSVRLSAALPTWARPGFGFDGFAAGPSLVLRTPLLRADWIGFAPYFGQHTMVGGWSGQPLAALGFELGGHVRLGSEQLGAVLEGGWAPTLVPNPGPSEMNGAGWAAAAGLHYDQVAFLLSWRGVNRPNGYSLHLFQLVFEVTP